MTEPIEKCKECPHAPHPWQPCTSNYWGWGILPHKCNCSEHIEIEQLEERSQRYARSINDLIATLQALPEHIREYDIEVCVPGYYGDSSFQSVERLEFVHHEKLVYLKGE